MEKNNDLTQLITVFKDYRDMLEPIEKCLREFSVTYEQMSGDIANLNSAFGGDIQGKLDKIYKDLSSQAEKARGLASQIDKFSSATKSYVQSVDSLVSVCGNIESKIHAVDDVQKRAEQQIDRLNVIIEEKKKTYNIKQLEKNLEAYNIGVQQVSDYINKDVGKVLEDNEQRIKSIQSVNESVLANLIEEKKSIDSLVEYYKASNNLLKKVVEQEVVNEEYIYTIIDKWANDRKVKTKK